MSAMKTSLTHLALAWALLQATPLSAQQPPPVQLSLTGQPTSWIVHGRPMEIQGFNNARFGMTVAQVRAVIAADHAAAMPTLKEATTADGGRALSIAVPSGPADAIGAQRTISYVFGANGRLLAVNASWLADGNATEAQRQGLLELGTALVTEMVGYEWPMLATARGHVIAPNTLILLAGQDERGAGVEIRLDGIALDVMPPDGAPASAAALHQPAPAGPARLRVALVANAEQPGTPTVAPGTF
jgi:hypothetical protein